MKLNAKSTSPYIFLLVLVFLFTFTFSLRSTWSKTQYASATDSLLQNMSAGELAAKLIVADAKTTAVNEWGANRFSLNKSGRTFLPDQSTYNIAKDTLVFSPNSSHFLAINSTQLQRSYVRVLELLLANKGVDWMFLSTAAKRELQDKKISIKKVCTLFPTTIKQDSLTFTKWIFAGGSEFITEVPVRSSQNTLRELWDKGSLGYLSKMRPELLQKKLTELIENGSIEKQQVIKRIKRLQSYKATNTKLTKKKINSISSKLQRMSQRVRHESITVIKDPEKRIPLPVADSLYVFAPHKLDYFADELEKYAPVKRMKSWKQVCSVRKKRVVIALAERVTSTKLQQLKICNNHNAFLIVNFAYSEQANKLLFSKALLQSYSSHKSDQKIAAQVLMGGRGANGNYPKLLSIQYSVPREGISKKPNRLQYPVGTLETIQFAGVDSIVKEAIQERAMPGCQIFVAHKGKVLLNKSYGYHTYNKRNKVQNTNLYDIASVSKIAGTTTALMHLYDKNKLNLMHTLGRYVGAGKLDTVRENLPERNIFDTKIYELLIHKSGIRPHPPILNYYFYEYKIGKKIRQMADSTIPKPLVAKVGGVTSPVENIIIELPKEQNKLSDPFDYYFEKKASNTTLQEPLAKRMYFKKQYRDSLLAALLLLPKAKKKRSKYSDVNFALLQLLIDSISPVPMQTIVEQQFAQLGIQRMRYLPLQQYTKKEIIPTELDEKWRKQLVWGHVHDPFAALLGGISGNAGLFSNAESLGIYAQWLLQGGSYGNKQTIRKQVVSFFTEHRASNNRALGFDTAERSSIVSRHANSKTFGHTGFTGCCVWVDPVNELVYVFLSNRVHPNAESKKLVRMRVRSHIHDEAYKYIKRKRVAR